MCLACICVGVGVSTSDETKMPVYRMILDPMPNDPPLKPWEQATHHLRGFRNWPLYPPQHRLDLAKSAQESRHYLPTSLRCPCQVAEPTWAMAEPRLVAKAVPCCDRYSKYQCRPPVARQPVLVALVGAVPRMTASEGP